MMTMQKLLPLLFVFVITTTYAQKKKANSKSVFLEDISWTIARDLLTADAVVVIPMGAGAKEHGPHLPLAADCIQAEAAARLLALQRKAIITPVVNYGFYPAFLKYAGSTSLDFTTATEMILGIVRNLSAYGPKRFYIINIGISTTPTIAAAAKILADEGILLYYSQYERSNFMQAEAKIKTQAFGGHANEIETSNLLYLRPDLVDMSKAVNDSSSKGMRGMLSPIKTEGTAYSPTGIVGYAALGTREKGKRSMQALVGEVIREFDSISTCALPQVKDRTEEYKKYEGEYTSPGRRNLIVQSKDNHLYYKLPDGSLFPFFQNETDYFTSVSLNILFVKDEEGQPAKAWCQSRGESFWMTKTK
jgi:creatinine amidohydrolase